MNRSHSFTARVQERPLRRDRPQPQELRRISSFQDQEVMKQDLNIDEFGDMGSDEDDFHSLASNYIPPKPPAEPQYNLVPYGFLRDDDELVEEDYDGVPIDDSASLDSPKKQPWKISPQKSQPGQIGGVPITVLGSSSWDSVPENRPGLGSSSLDRASLGKINSSSNQLIAGRWDKKREPASGLGNNRNISPFLDSTSKIPQHFDRSDDDGSRFLKTNNQLTFAGAKPTGSSASLVQSIDDRNPFLKTGTAPFLSGSTASFVSAKGDNTFHQYREDTPRWNDKHKSAEGSTPVWAEKGREPSRTREEQVQESTNQIFTPTSFASTSSQLELIQQAAALQQALSGLTQISSQSGLNLMSAQNLLMQATQHPSLAAALVSSGIRSMQPNTLNDPAVEALLKSSVPTATDLPQSSSGLLTYPLRASSFRSSSSRKSIPDGSGAKRYPAPDVSSLVFDPSTGYRFDASSGLHYDANSGYFFNSELKLFLRWDKFSQTYLKVDNPPAIPRFCNSATDRISYIAGSQESQHCLSPLTSIPVCAPLKNDTTAIALKDSGRVSSSSGAISTDSSKPFPSLPHTHSDSRFPPSGMNPSNVTDQKAAALPNFAETSLFNKLRKAKLAQTAQTKFDRKRWGSPDPLLEAAQKHAAETNDSAGSILDMKEILQRSRQFMKQKTGNLVEKETNRSQDQRKNRSRSRSVGRPRRSLSPVDCRGRPSIAPQNRRCPPRSPERRLHGRPASRGRSPKTKGRGSPSFPPSRKEVSTSKSGSPINKGRGKGSLSPVAKKRSASRSRIPAHRAHNKASLSPEIRKRRPASRGRSPTSVGKSSKSPARSHFSRGRSSERRSHQQISRSPELRKSIHQSRTLNRSQSPKVKVVLDQSCGGSKSQVRSPGHSNKRSADGGDLHADRRKLRRKMSPSPKRARARSIERRQSKDSGDGKTGLSDQKLAKDRFGARGSNRGGLDRDKITELKPIPYDKPQRSSKNSSGKGTDISDYKSLSNLRNQGKDKPREKETEKKQDNLQQNKNKSYPGTLTAEVDLTADSDDDKRGRANHRLVSERTFSRDWERKKPSPVPKLSPTKKNETTESSRSAKGNEEKLDGKDGNKVDTDDKNQSEESNDFDFLNDTLDDDKESTVVDEYEEILDYQDLENNSEVQVEESAPKEDTTTTDVKGIGESLFKEPVRSPGIDFGADPKDQAIEASKSPESDRNNILCSSVEESKSEKITSKKRDSLGDGAVGAQDEGGSIELGRGEVGDEDIGGIELHDQEGLVVVGEKVGEPFKAPQTLEDRNTSDGKEHVNFKVKTCGKTESSKRADLSLVQGNTPEDGPATNDNPKKSTELNEIASEVKDDTNKTVELKCGKMQNDTSISPTETTSKPPNLESPIMEADGSGVTPNSSETKCKDDGLTTQSETSVGKNELNQQLPEHDAKNIGTGAQVVAIAGTGGEPHLCGIDNIGQELNAQAKTDEPLVQVRSVSDIEKFLLLSSQEVEAKREQGIDPTSGKNDKKSDVFSRLGEKLPTDEVSGEPTAELELPSETSESAPGPSNKVPASPTNVVKPKAIAASKTQNKSKKADPKDPVATLFSDVPTSQILIGPMNFIEPLKNFQQFTQRYMEKLLQQEKVKFRKIFVCHEDVTGAPYHYILVMFHTVREASGWFKKHKGKFKADEKLFKRVAGHLKHKFIQNAEAFLHFTESNWFCKVCKKGNFPPRSLCFNCFQHKDPEGFSPVTILDKGQQHNKQSKFVGTPKLKFFVTKEKVIESAPPLDGFDIKSIEMVIDEKMGLPAGICVFELPNYIDAGKLKKYLTHREIEAVSVQVHERTTSELTSPSVSASKKIPPKVDGKAERRRSSEEKRCLESDGIPGRSSRFSSEEIEPPRGHLPISPWEERVLRSRSPSAVRDMLVPRVRSLTPPRGRSRSLVRDVRVTRDLLCSPPRGGRVSRGRSPSPFGSLRVARGPSLSPVRDLRVSRGRSPGVRNPRGRLPSPMRSRERVLSRSPRRFSPGYQPRAFSPRREIHDGSRYPSPEGPPRGRRILDSPPRFGGRGEPRRLHSRERVRSPVPHRSPGYQSPPRYRSRSPVFVPPRSRSPSPRYRAHSPVRPTKPDGRGKWRYPPPDPANFRFEPLSGLDYDPTTTLYYEPKSCCFYNDDTNEWLEYNPRTERYTLVR